MSRTQLNLATDPATTELFKKMARYKRQTQVQYFGNLVAADAADVEFCECGEIISDWREILASGTITLTCPACGKKTVFKDVNNQKE